MAEGLHQIKYLAQSECSVDVNIFIELITFYKSPLGKIKKSHRGRGGRSYPPAQRGDVGLTREPPLPLSPVTLHRICSRLTGSQNNREGMICMQLLTHFRQHSPVKWKSVRLPVDSLFLLTLFVNISEGKMKELADHHRATGQSSFMIKIRTI